MNPQMEYCSTFNADSSETVAYNNPLFPVYVRYGKLSFYPDYSAISHWHADLEFILVKKGHMTYNVNGTLVELYANNGIMVNSRQLHYGFSAERQDCEFICILFSPELFQVNSWFYQNFIEAVTENASYMYLLLSSENTWQNAILNKLQDIYACYSNPLAGTFPDAQIYFDIIEHLNSIMKLLYQHLPEKQNSAEDSHTELPLLKSMLAYLENHYADHVTLQDIAAAGTCCKSKCSHLFRSYLCDTPISYLTKLRLRKSLSALLDSDTGITDIALACGFSGASYYCETFRKYYGISPLKYRKNFMTSSTTP